MLLQLAFIALLAATYAPTGPNFVANASLEQWKAGVPVGWELSEGTCDAWQPATARQSPDNHGGKVALKLAAPAEPTHEVRLRQAITLDPAALPLGGRLHLSAAIQADAPGVTLAFHYRRANTDHTEGVPVTGNGAWEVVSQEFLLPPDAEPASLAITITRAPGLAGPVLIDDIQLRAMAEATPPPADDPAEQRPRKKPHGFHP